MLGSSGACGNLYASIGEDEKFRWGVQCDGGGSDPALVTGEASDSAGSSFSSAQVQESGSERVGCSNLVVNVPSPLYTVKKCLVITPHITSRSVLHTLCSVKTCHVPAVGEYDDGVAADDVRARVRVRPRHQHRVAGRERRAGEHGGEALAVPDRRHEGHEVALTVIC